MMYWPDCLFDPLRDRFCVPAQIWFESPIQGFYLEDVSQAHQFYLVHSINLNSRERRRSQSYMAQLTAQDPVEGVTFGVSSFEQKHDVP